MTQVGSAPTGALCCVAARPHGTKSNLASRDCSMDPNEPCWRMNSSFSPPMSRRWDCRNPSDGLPHRIHDAPPYVSSLSSHSKGSRSAFGSDQYLNHQHSVSDGALSYFGSPADSLQAPRWTPSLQRFDLGEFSTPAGGSRPDTSGYPQSSERQLTAVSSFSSASPFSESSQLASSSKPPYLHLPRNHLGRRSFMSKPVYPLVFRNPVSEAEASGMPEASNIGRTTPSDDSPVWRRSLASPELKFHNALSEFRKVEASPEPNTSSRREGFRWSNASSYDFGYDGDAIDISDHISVESQRSPTSSVRFLKCGLCERFLRQKSPWTSNRIVQNSDMPVAAVLPCRHVFHADCLEESTPKSQVHEPPCPLCTRGTDDEGCVSFSEPLHVALRSARRNQGNSFSLGGSGGSTSANPSRSDHGLKRNQSALVARRSGTMFRNRFKKQFSFKGRFGKDLFGGRVFKKVGSSSSSGQQDDRQQPKA
uniref:RING-type domain-containing protein n=1 Tax=Oryza glumipatula TaxID=40148 RepID=A0A0D9Z6N3_9ORYZ